MGSNFGQSEQDRGYAGLLEDLVTKVNRTGELSEQARRDAAGAASEIAKLKADVQRGERAAAERFAAAVQRYGQADGRPHKGYFPTREMAQEFGLRVLASYGDANGDGLRTQAQAKLQTAGISPLTGPAGGYLLPEPIVEAIVRNLEDASVWERNTRVLPAKAQAASVPVRSGGLTVYYPDFEGAVTPSAPTFARKAFSLGRWAVAALLERWMLSMDLMVALGEFVAEEIAYALSLAQDTNWFIGDGTSTYRGYTGLLKDTTIKSWTPTDDYDEFSEIIAVSSQELAKLLGQMPAYVTSSKNAKWYMHSSIFFGLLAIRDTGGMPIASLYTSGTQWERALMGYPVEFCQVLPALGGAGDTVSSPMLLYGDLRMATRTVRNPEGTEIRTSEHVKFLENQLCTVGEVLQDRAIVDANAMGRLITHS